MVFVVNIEGFGMKILFCPFMLFLISTMISAAQGPEIPSDTPPPAVVEGSDSETAGNDQSLAAQREGLRDPFWPVGYSPRSEKREEETKAIEEEQADLAADEELWNTLQKKLRIAGVAVVGDKKMATINNRLVEEGGIVGIRHENREFRWKISEITDSRRVRFTRLDIIPRP